MQLVRQTALHILDAKNQVGGVSTPTLQSFGNLPSDPVIDEVIIALRTKFATKTDDWDDQDEICYSMALVGITAQNAAQIVASLRLKHTWMPSVAEVAEAVKALLPAVPAITARTAPPEITGTAQALAYTNVPKIVRDKETGKEIGIIEIGKDGAEILLVKHEDSEGWKKARATFEKMREENPLPENPNGTRQRAALPAPEPSATELEARRQSWLGTLRAEMGDEDFKNRPRLTVSEIEAMTQVEKATGKNNG
jgi:hypothetical protein